MEYGIWVMADASRYSPVGRQFPADVLILSYDRGIKIETISAKLMVTVLKNRDLDLPQRDGD